MTREALGALGVALIAASVLLYSDRTPFPGLGAVPPCLGTALLIYVGASAEPPAVSRLLAWRARSLPSASFSYSLYLVHWPLIELFENMRPESLVTFYLKSMYIDDAS
jgi:peptidoglycan/LPS O-acetylase OafA/YrhL